MSYFRRQHHRRLPPVMSSSSGIAPFAHEQPVEEQQYLAYDRPRPSYTFPTRPLSPGSQYFDADPSIQNFSPQRQIYRCEPQWKLPSFQQSLRVNPDSQVQDPVPFRNHRYYCEDAPPTRLVPQAPATPHDSDLSYTITNLPQANNYTSSVIIVRPNGADAPTVDGTLQTSEPCHPDGHLVDICRCFVQGSVDERLQDGAEPERPPTRGTPPVFVRRPYQNSEDEQSQDEEQSHDTAGVARSVEEGSISLSREEILIELELLVSVMRQLLSEYRVLSMAGEEGLSEQEDVLGEDERTGEDADLEGIGEERA